MFITLEGGEGSGKSTVQKEIGIWLTDKFGLQVITLYEPGSTRIGNEIRKVLHNKEYQEMSPRAEALLYQASRSQLVDQIIRPELSAGKVVLLDRYADSSRVYQGIGRDLGIEAIDWLIDFATGGLKPDITFLLDVDPEIGMARKKDGNKEINRMDLQKMEFYKKVQNAYRELAIQNKDGRWRYIPTDRPLEYVVKRIQTVIESEMGSIQTERRTILKPGGKER